MSTHLSEAICERPPPPSREEIVWVVVLLITCRKPGMINNAEKLDFISMDHHTAFTKCGLNIS